MCSGFAVVVRICALEVLGPTRGWGDHHHLLPFRTPCDALVGLERASASVKGGGGEEWGRIGGGGAGDDSQAWSRGGRRSGTFTVTLCGPRRVFANTWKPACAVS